MSPRVEKCASGKRRHKTYEEALFAPNEMPGFVYFCRRCRGFHATLRVQWRKRRGRGKQKRGSAASKSADQ